MSSSEVIPDYTKITDVKQEFLTSRKTVERRRDRAREQGDSQIYRMFKLRTKDGTIVVEPTLEQVNTLTKEGRVPEWFVARSWLEKEFGKRSDQPSRHENRRRPSSEVGDSSAAVLGALRQQYESRINDLKDQLLAAERREEKAMEYAERDKQRFATATAQLTQVLALPGITEATKAQKAPIKAAPSPTVDVDTHPPVEPPPPTPAGQAKQKPANGVWTRLRKLL